MTASEIQQELGIPAPTLYRLAKKGDVPYVDVTKPWHKQKHYLFRVEDVRNYIERRAQERGE